MGTHNFTDIAKSVAKSAYTYVVCNTYIHRVYIKMLVASSTVLTCPSLTALSYLPLSAHLRKQEAGFMKCNSGIRKHESNFSESKSMNKISHKCLD